MAGSNRVITVTGGIFVATFTVGLVLLGGLVGSFADSDETFVEHFSSGSQRGVDIAGSVLLVVAAVVFVYFTQLIGSADPETSTRTATLVLVRAAGMLAGVGMLVAALAFFTVPLSISLGEFYDEVGGAFGESQAVLPQFGSLALGVAAMFPAAITVVAIARLRLFPTWLTRLSYAVGVLLVLTSLTVVTMILLPVWVALATLSLRQSANESIA